MIFTSTISNVLNLGDLELKTHHYIKNTEFRFKLRNCKVQALITVATEYVSPH